MRERDAERHHAERTTFALVLALVLFAVVATCGPQISDAVKDTFETIGRALR